MINKLKDIKYGVLINYYFIGIIISVFVFVFVQHLLLQDVYSMSTIFNMSLLRHEVASLIGALVGGVIFVFSLNYDGQIQFDKKQLEKYKSKGKGFIFFENILTFSFAAFAGFLTKNLIEISGYDELFSKQNTVDYIAIIIAGAVFGLFLAIGKVRRIKQINIG